MAKITKTQLFAEIKRAGEVAKISSAAIAHIQSSVADRTRISTYTLHTRNGISHPLVYAGVVDVNGDIQNNKFLKSDKKVDKFFEFFAPTGETKKRDSTVDVG